MEIEESRHQQRRKLSAYLHVIKPLAKPKKGNENKAQTSAAGVGQSGTEPSAEPGAEGRQAGEPGTDEAGQPARETAAVAEDAGPKKPKPKRKSDFKVCFRNTLAAGVEKYKDGPPRALSTLPLKMLRLNRPAFHYDLRLYRKAWWTEHVHLQPPSLRKFPERLKRGRKKGDNHAVQNAWSPPPRPDVLLANPDMVRRRRWEFNERPQKAIRKKMPHWPLDTFYDYHKTTSADENCPLGNQGVGVYAFHIRNLNLLKTLGKPFNRESRKFHAIRLLKPRFDDTPLKSLYRIYEYLVIDDYGRLRAEVEYFYNQTDWRISEIPDPEDSDPVRAAVLAATVKILIRWFNALYQKGHRRSADVCIDGRNREIKPMCLQEEREPEWLAHIRPLEEKLRLPHGDGTIIIFDETYPKLSKEFLEYNIVRRRPRMHFRYFEPKEKQHRTDKEVLQGVAKSAIKASIGITAAAVNTSKGTANAVTSAGKWTKTRAVNFNGKWKKTKKHVFKKQPVKAGFKKAGRIWTTRTPSAKAQDEDDGGMKGYEHVTFERGDKAEKTTYKLGEGVYLIKIAYGVR